ncbi:hypothetical protein BGS_0464 [Beggiatoa sp. SS]|nr:hypothetical protein BGS_0464 [Beggiatoa sp. SS]
MINGEWVYLVEGGLNGGGHEVCLESVKPMNRPIAFTAAGQQQIAQAFTTFLSSDSSLVAELINCDFGRCRYSVFYGPVHPENSVDYRPHHAHRCAFD